MCHIFCWYSPVRTYSVCLRVPSCQSWFASVLLLIILWCSIRSSAEAGNFATANGQSAEAATLRLQVVKKDCDSKSQHECTLIVLVFFFTDNLKIF